MIFRRIWHSGDRPSFARDRFLATRGQALNRPRPCLRAPSSPVGRVAPSCAGHLVTPLLPCVARPVTPRYTRCGPFLRIVDGWRTIWPTKSPYRVLLVPKGRTMHTVAVRARHIVLHSPQAQPVRPQCASLVMPAPFRRVISPPNAKGRPNAGLPSFRRPKRLTSQNIASPSARSKPRVQRLQTST